MLSREEAPGAIADIVAEMNEDVAKVFDIEHMVMKLFTENKALHMCTHGTYLCTAPPSHAESL